MFKLFLNAQNKKTKKRAFTLVELVIVIVILGILATVAAISFSDTTRKAGDSVAKANLRAIKSAIQMYTVDKNGTFPDDIKNADLLNIYDPELAKLVKGQVADHNYTYTMDKNAGTIQVDRKDPAETVLTINYK